MSYNTAPSCTEPSPVIRNQLLESLSETTWPKIKAEIEQIDLPLGGCLHHAGSALRHVYFPATAVVSLVSEMRDGSSAEAAVIGCEGLVGVCACMGSVLAHNTAVVQTGGLAWRMDVHHFVRMSWQCEELMRRVLRYGQALMLHIAQTSACNRHHPVHQRLCRWLLSLLDRQQGDEMHVTHERIAAMLGVRREIVSAAAFKLQAAGLIRYGRGHLQVLDRAGLEARSCECHAIIRAAYDDVSCSDGDRPPTSRRVDARHRRAAIGPLPDNAWHSFV